ncbi:cullin homolog 1-like [Cochliomyia hominivorax]
MEDHEKKQKRKNHHEIWTDLEVGIKQIFQEKQSFTMERYMQLYDCIYYCCTTIVPNKSKHEAAKINGKKLYKHLKIYLKNYLSDLCKKLLIIKDDGSLLVQYRKQWIHYQHSSKILNGICSHLNRYWIKREYEEGGQKCIYEIYRLALVTWKEQLFETLNDHLTNAILKSIDEERRGKTINRLLLRDVINSYVELGCHAVDKLYNNDCNRNEELSVYRNYFEMKFLAETAVFYKNESEKLLGKNTVTEYMEHIVKRLDEEGKRVKSLDSARVPYLHFSTLDKLVETVLLVKNHVYVFLAEFQINLNANKNDDLKRMYNLVAHIPCIHDELKVILEEHIFQQGYRAIKKSNNTDPIIYVQTILEVYRKYNTLISKVSSNGQVFILALDNACRKFINTNVITQFYGASKSPELLAKYCDILLSNSSEDPTERELIDKINQVMIVIEFIEKKNVFLMFYTKMIVERLANHTSISRNLEIVMLSKLEKMCGTEYTIELQRILVSQKFKE